MPESLSVKLGAGYTPRSCVVWRKLMIVRKDTGASFILHFLMRLLARFRAVPIRAFSFGSIVFSALLCHFYDMQNRVLVFLVQSSFSTKGNTNIKLFAFLANKKANILVEQFRYFLKVYYRNLPLTRLHIINTRRGLEAELISKLSLRKSGCFPCFPYFL